MFRWMIATGWALLAATSTASASCYESIGCTDADTFKRSQLTVMSCQVLWEVRNQIFHENGYCFRSKRAKSVFSNDDCSVSHSGDVVLNKTERANVGLIRQVEAAKGC